MGNLVGHTFRMIFVVTAILLFNQYTDAQVFTPSKTFKKEYHLNKELLNYGESEHFCCLHSAHLAKIESDDERDWILKNVYEKEYKEEGGSDFWIGLSDKKTSYHFKWFDGSPVTYTNWYNGTPDCEKACCGVGVHVKEKCWASANCSVRINALCERPLRLKSHSETTNNESHDGCSKFLPEAITSDVKSSEEGNSKGLGIINWVLIIIAIVITVVCFVAGCFVLRNVRRKRVSHRYPVPFLAKCDSPHSAHGHDYAYATTSLTCSKDDVIYEEVEHFQDDFMLCSELKVKPGTRMSKSAVTLNIYSGARTPNVSQENIYQDVMPRF